MKISSERKMGYETVNDDDARPRLHPTPFAPFAVPTPFAVPAPFFSPVWPRMSPIPGTVCQRQEAIELASPSGACYHVYGGR